MSAAPPIVFHQPQHIHAGTQEEKQRAKDEHPHRAKLPVIPDLRFEYSYLRSIQSFVEVERVGENGGEGEVKQTTAEVLDKALLDEGYETLDATLGFKGKEHEEGFAEGTVEVGPGGGAILGNTNARREVIRVQWKKILWVTLRDQVISPLAQGALWAVAGYYITPFSAQVGSKMGTFVREHAPLAKKKDGEGLAWLRNWWQSLNFSSSGNSTNFTASSLRTR